jgi:hypothetical protein
MLRQRTPRRLAPLERRHSDLLCQHRHLGGGVSLRRILFQIGKLEFELVKQCATFRRLSELTMPQLFDRELELLDQQRLSLSFGFRSQPRGALRAQHRLQCGDIVRKRIIGAHHQRLNHSTVPLSDRRSCC